MKLEPNFDIHSPEDRQPQTRTQQHTWRSVQDYVLSRIRTREWRPGDLIPTEHQLAEELGCARATVNRAMRDLAESGVVERRRKVGTRVAERPTHCSITLPSIRREVEHAGQRFKVRFLDMETVAAPAEALDALGMKAESELIRVRSLFLANEQPCSFEMKWINPDVAEGMTLETLDELTVYEWLSQHAAITRANVEIMASGANESEAEYMKLTVATPLLTMLRTLWSQEVPVSYARQVFVPGYSIRSIV